MKALLPPSILQLHALVLLIAAACCLALILTPALDVMGQSPPSSSEKKLEHQAQTAYDNGMSLLAISILKQLPYHNNPRLLTNLGSAENEIGNYTGAISFYKKALEIDPHHVGALAGIGGTLDMLGNHSAAPVTIVLEYLTGR